MRRDTADLCSKLLLTLLLLIRSWHVAGDAFSCNFSIVGNSSYPSNLTFAEVSIGCTPVPPTDISSKLNLFVDQSLMPYSAAFSGAEHIRDPSLCFELAVLAGRWNQYKSGADRCACTCRG